MRFVDRRCVWESLGLIPLADLRVLVVVQSLMDDLAPVLGEFKMPRVLGVVTPLAEAVLVGVLGIQGDQLA